MRRSGSWAGTAPGRRPCCKLVSGIFKPTSGRIETGGRIGSLLELGAGFHPDFTGRENVYLNGSIHGLSRARIREVMDEIIAFAELERAIDLPVRTYSSGMYMRLGFSVAVHIQADVLLLDEVFAVGDEDFQRKCFGKIREFKLRGGTIVFVSHDAQAVERLCDRAVLLRRGSVVFDGETREAIAQYRRLLAGDRSPDELASGLREWGTGEARILSARLLDSDGDERRQFRAGEPAVVELTVTSDEAIAAPHVSLELRDDNGVALGGVSQPTAELGWGTDRRRRAQAPLRDRPAPARRRAVPPPLRARRRRRRAAAALLRRRRPVPRLSRRRRDRGAPARGTMDDAGDRRRQHNPTRMSSRTCPDWPQLMEIAPELQFKHYTLREVQLPADVLAATEALNFDEIAICCDLESHVFYAEHTDPAIGEALRASHWFDLREWASRSPGSNIG